MSDPQFPRSALDAKEDTVVVKKGKKRPLAHQRALMTTGIKTGREDRVSVQMVERALRRGAGIPARAARLLTKALGFKVTDRAVKKLIRKYPILYQVRLEAQNELIEVAFDNMAEGIHVGDKGYTMFFINHYIKLRREMPEMGAGFFFDENGKVSNVVEDVDYSVYSDEELGQLRSLAKKAEERDPSVQG